MPRYEIDLAKKYRFPDEINIVEYEGKFLVISPNTACWIVLESQEQIAVFDFLRCSHSIGSTLENELFSKRDVSYVVTQIEARRFFNKDVRSTTENERSLHLYLTNFCNLHCPHCYMFSGKANKDELSTDEVLKLLSDYKNEAGGTRLILSGGEPITRLDFDIIVQKASELGLEVKVLTNGVLMTRDRIRKIGAFINSVQISIDGFSEDTNSTVRGKGQFNKALEAVDALLENGIETSIAMTPPHEILKDSVEHYVTFAKSLVEKYKGKPFMLKFSEDLIPGREINPSKSEKTEYISLIEDIQKRVYGDNYDVYQFIKAFGQNNIMDNCMFGVFAVASDGNVYFCARTGNLQPIANVRRDSMKKICELSSCAEKATLISNLRPCKYCELKFICGGGCRIDEFPNLIDRTSFDGIDYNLIPERKCSDAVKNRFYSLMVRSNKFLYKELEQ